MGTRINIGVFGATGHTGEELVDILLKHPQVCVSRLYNTSQEPQVFSEVFARFKKRINLTCNKPDYKEIEKHCDLVFLALPHTVSMTVVPRLLALKKKIVDLSADYRFKSKREYERAYGIKHKDAAHIKQAVYGLPELHRSEIRNAHLVANPGCYPTCAVLGLAPLFALGITRSSEVIVDAKSGVTGAGKKMTHGFIFSEVNEDFKAYKVDTHQHAPEITQALNALAGDKVGLTFVPHLLPLNRGILATMYVRKNPKHEMRSSKLLSLYRKFYKTEPFVRVKEEGEFPRIKDVVHTNFCDIGIRVSDEYIIVIAAIDNLTKGAAGQAVQNMNIMCRFPETMGLL